MAAIWGAHDPQSDIVYLFSEYHAEGEPAIHAAAIRSRGDWIPGLIDPAANGRNPADGCQLIQMYRNLGIALESVANPLESGILNVWERMHSGRLKVFGSLGKYLGERRLYRRDEREQIVGDRDSLQDATRCLLNGISRMSTKPEPPEPWHSSVRPRGWLS